MPIEVADPLPRVAESTAPLGYPMGWFWVADARELKPGTVRRSRLMDGDVVVYRTRSGLVRAVRPYCPHLGAHLGAGGTVAGENLVCPFHHFEFAPDGRCVDSPDGATIPVGLNHYELREQHGQVFVWRGPEGQSPTWELPEVADFGVAPIFGWSREIPTHAQELAENAADFRHLSVLHDVHMAEAEPCEADGPIFRVHTRSTGQGRVGLFESRQTIVMAGLGYTHIRFAIPRLGVVAHMWAMQTPIAPWRTHVYSVFAWESTGGAVSRVLAPVVARLASQAMTKVLSEDIPIWENKRYNPHPRLVAGESTLSRFRLWTRQFYPSE
ncbi:aromatic ring-hydroxylating dioxygenase subunit alpha [Nocardia sp. NPDC004151]|uniref:aromatic ring-hydroxylating oxygenase subunit alpha n=1 Tax=Nocardia sp. NPDC004151 TaxID=3364304 RepID=UPI00369F4C91